MSLFSDFFPYADGYYWLAGLAWVTGLPNKCTYLIIVTGIVGFFKGQM